MSIFFFYCMADHTKEEEQFLTELGTRLRQLRKEKGYSSHEKFAYQSDINRTLYGSYERGEHDMRVLTLLKLLKALDVTLEEFFEGFDI